MRIKIDLTPAHEAMLSDLADQAGCSKEECASFLLSEALKQTAREREAEAEQQAA